MLYKLGHIYHTDTIIFFHYKNFEVPATLVSKEWN